MTIDEAIAHAKEKAEQYRFRIKNRLMTMLEIEECEREMEEHEQIAELLEELKDMREIKDTITSNANALEQNGYNKAIDDFVEEVSKVKYSSENYDRYGYNDDYYDVVDFDDIQKIAKQLKTGESCENN